ncbi:MULTISPECIES: glucose 1-dehydrogenase [Thermomonosporaceae]|uniref:glucose 1-dehydrogenase n=1 Tax=Thermomonosporaceae TaxID=2012 RepID=UPI00255AAA13|nr:MULTISPECIES: glucose 1-dehydrogenase [Thermomonosporaceae]MDL4774641.1 glucose 1-dehydrogenase [Actinomadura xylanilytica]
MGLMDGRAGLVTGASAGLGRAMARAFAAEGASVVVSDIDEPGGAETVRLIEEDGGTASFARADTTSEEQVAALVGTVVERYGQLDWAVNNAGLGAPSHPVAEQRAEWWDRVLSVDVLGVLFGLKHQIIQMTGQGGGGAIVNTASTAGLTGQYGLSPYVSAKWAVIGLTKTAALEYAKAGVRVNAICPGMTMTPAVRRWTEEVPEQAAMVAERIPMGRIGEPDDQAQAALWLCSPRSAYITGVALPVDGGDTID